MHAAIFTTLTTIWTRERGLTYLAPAAQQLFSYLHFIIIECGLF